MPQWLGGSREPSLPDLIARRKYGRAIEVLREQLQRETPTIQSRLQLADLLVQAGRRNEAVPVFLELADELSREGFVAKAIAILKRVERVAPGTDVEDRLEELVRTQRRLGAEAATPGPTATVPMFGMEVIPDEEPELELEPDAEPEAGSAAEMEIEPDVEPEIEPDAEELEVEPEPDAEVEPEIEAEEALEVEPDPDADGLVLEVAPDESDASSPDTAEAAAPSPPPDSGKGVGARIRNAFQRFLGTLPTPAVAPEPPDEEPIVVDAEEVGDGEPLSEAAFEGKLLDTIEGALKEPLPRRPAEGAPRPSPVQRLVATPLFGTLDEEELLAVVRELQLRTFRPGDVVITEGEHGERSLFVISAGRVRVFVRGPSGRDVQLGALGEGDFFGEMSGLSGRPRAATITAAEDCELLELPQTGIDAIARRHPRVRQQLENHFVERASSPEAAAVRAVPLVASKAQEAREVLAAHFGEERWDPKMRLRLARLLLQSGKEDDALPVLIALADELSRAGETAKAVAVIKKVEQIQNRHVQEIPLAPLERRAGDAHPAEPEPEPHAETEAFQRWLVDMVRDRVTGGGARAAPAAVPTGYGGLQASPLFAGFSEEELVALFQGFSLRRAEAGELLVTEGERSEGLFVLCSGRVRLYVRDPAGRNVELCELADGAFFGEISTLSGQPRSATVCAASGCDLLELNRAALDDLTRKHPRVRRVLEEFVAARSASEDAARIRGRRGAGAES